MAFAGSSKSGVGAATIAALLVMGCQNNQGNDDRVMAQAYNDKLYWSDLRRAVPMDASPEDSAAIAMRFIDNWAKDRVILHMAEANLDKSQLKLDEKLKAYRESLLTFAYEQALVAQTLDSVVTPAQIKAYYQENSANFQLKDNIVRVRWFKLRKSDRQRVKDVERLWRNNREEDQHKLEVMLARMGVAIIDTQDDWEKFTNLQQQIPLRPENPTDWLQRNARAMASDSAAVYFVEILDHRLKDSIAPMELVEPRIRSIIINTRKLELISRLRKEMYTNAVANKDVRFP